MQTITHRALRGSAPLNAFILENEPLGMANIKSMLARNCKNVTILAEGGTVSKGKEILAKAKNTIDFALLDINLDDGLVFSLLPEIKRRGIDFLFVSAYPEYAAEAFKLDAAHFVTKPINSEDLVEAINRVAARKYLNNTAIEQPPIPQSKKILLSDNEGIYWVDIHDIIRCKADDVYTFIYLNTGKRLLICKNIGYFQSLLEPHRLFFRTERSNLINVNYLDQLIMEDGLTFVLLKNGDKIPLARRRRKAFRQFLEGK